MKKYAAILLLFATTAFSADLITKVIQLNYISASDAERVLNPLLSPGESISNTNNQLVVNVSPETLTKLRVVLHDIDVPPVVFGIFIHQGPANWLDTNDNDDTVYSSNSQSQASDSQSVQVMSGASAFVSMGSNVPVVSSVGIGWWQSGVSYQRENVSQGFLIQPQLQGQQVKLKIRRVNDRVNNVNSQQIDNQNVDTTTMIPLDQWVKLGSTGQADLGADNSSDVVYSTGQNYQSKSTLLIKVSVIK
jgi:hypothetical protein